jgi:predicted nucleotidyltransferase
MAARCAAGEFSLFEFPMRLVFAAGVLFFGAVRAYPDTADPSQDVTVLVDFEKPYSEASVDALRSELQTLFAPWGLKIDLRVKNQLPPGAEFNQLMVFKMKGACSMVSMPIGALSDERGPLAMTYSSDGELLHFGEVECDRVRHSLERVLGKGHSEKRQTALGTALGMVMAHEMYHMMANVKGHTGAGVTKHSLSAEEMLAGDLAIPDAARKAVQHVAGSPY